MAKPPVNQPPDGTARPLSLRERQRAQVRSDIRRAAFRLFAADGFDNVTTEQIAAAARVSTSTFFRHVATKEELLLDEVRLGAEAIASLFEQRPGTESPDVALAHAIEARIDAFQHSGIEHWRAAILAAPGLLEKVSVLNPVDRGRLVKIAAARMRSDAEHDSRPALLVHLAFAAADFAFQQWVRAFEDNHRPLRAFVAEALQAVMSPYWQPSHTRSAAPRK